MDVITSVNLKKYYGSARGLEDATLSVREGEIYGFVGPNGSGKTTFIRILAGLIHASAGTVSVFGMTPGPDSAAINKDIGYMPGESFYYPELKVGSVLSFFARERGCGTKRMDELAQALDLDLNKRIDALSFGNRKKVGIVAAMLHQPRLLVLDEPTTGLDPLVQRIFLDLMRAEQRRGTTVFLSSHNLTEVEKVCDRVALVKEGKILPVTTIMDLVKQKHKRLIVAPALDLSLSGLSKNGGDEHETYYEYRGETAPLLTLLAASGLSDVVIRDATLEEIFIGHYERGNGQ